MVTNIPLTWGLQERFPNENLITFECRSYWHTNSNLEGAAGGNVEMDAIAIKGGTISSSNYEFINTGGTLEVIIHLLQFLLMDLKQ
jgi:hypothetical protein